MARNNTMASPAIPHESHLWDQIEEFQKQHERHTRAWYNEPIELLENTLASLAAKLDELNYVPKEKWTDQHKLQILFLSKTPHTLHSANQQLLSGDYHESMSTTRIAYEAILRVCFVVAFPDDFWAIVHRPAKGKRQFNASDFLVNTLKVAESDPFYEFLSYSVHSLISSVVDELQEAHTVGRMAVTLGYRYDKRSLQVALNSLLCVTAFSAEIMTHTFGMFLSQDNRSHLNVGDLLSYISQLPGQISQFPKTLERVRLALDSASLGQQQ